MDATTAIIQALVQARAAEQTDRHDLTIDRHTVLSDTLQRAFWPEQLAGDQEQPHQAELCERCGNESPGPLVAMGADWGDGAALYAGVCPTCVQEHADYWAQR